MGVIAAVVGAVELVHSRSVPSVCDAEPMDLNESGRGAVAGLPDHIVLCATFERYTGLETDRLWTGLEVSIGFDSTGSTN